MVFFVQVMEFIQACLAESGRAIPVAQGVYEYLAAMDLDLHVVSLVGADLVADIEQRLMSVICCGSGIRILLYQFTTALLLYLFEMLGS